MATVRDIVQSAFEMAKVVATGDPPTADESDAGLKILQSYYLRIADTALRPAPVYVTEDYTADEGERVYGDGLTLSLPDVIDGACGTRLPSDLACIQLNSGTGWATHISDRGTWVQVDSLTLNSDAPFASRNAEGLSAIVATRLGRFGGVVDPDVEMEGLRFRTQMQPVDLTPNEYF